MSQQYPALMQTLTDKVQENLREAQYLDGPQTTPSVRAAAWARYYESESILQTVKEHPHGLGGYQELAHTTAISNDPLEAAFGLGEEAGEVLGKFKRSLRDGTHPTQLKQEVSKELGDVLWYVAELATRLGLSLEQIATENLAKLADRAARNQIAGSGDNR